MKTDKKVDIRIYICKYLKILRIGQNFAPNSIKAYLSDLGQILFENTKIFIGLEDSSENVKFFQKKRENTFRINFEMNEEQLLEIIAQGLRSWSGLAPASRNRKFSVVKGFLSFLYLEGCLSEDFGAQIVCPKVPKKIPHFLSVDEILSILSFISSSGYENKQEKLLFLLLYGGGLRISEACSLQWAQVSKNYSEILIKGKGNKERLIVLPLIVQLALNEYKEVTPKNNRYIFGEEQLSPRKGYCLIRSLGKKVGLAKSLNPHALRHSFATHLLVNGADIRVLQQILGHESLLATEKYLHLSIDHLALTVENLHPLSSSISARRT